MIKLIKNQIRFLLGSGLARQAHKQQIQDAKNYVKSIEHFKCFLNAHNNKDQDAPIFILSAGWRTGSTLLQRLISSSDDLFLWGEPFDKSNIIESLSDTLKPFSPIWPPRAFTIDEEKVSDYAQKWIANLYPTEDTLRLAHRRFLDTLFAEPARKVGAKRWGLKEVRFGLQEAIFLKLIYPNAKFLYLERDLHDAYISYRNFKPQMNWHAKWPSRHVFTPFAFARHRARLIGEFKLAQEITGGLFIQYSNLITDKSVLTGINEYCSLGCNQDVLTNKVGSGDGESSNIKTSKKLARLEKSLLKMGDYMGTLSVNKIN